MEYVKVAAKFCTCVPIGEKLEIPSLCLKSAAICAPQNRRLFSPRSAKKIRNPHSMLEIGGLFSPHFLAAYFCPAFGGYLRATPQKSANPLSIL